METPAEEVSDVNALTVASAQKILAAAAIDTPEGLERLCRVRLWLDFYKSAIKELEAAWESRAMERVEACGKFSIGPVTYSVGREKVTRCRNVGFTIQSLLEACGGDFEALVSCLSANAIKYGAARSKFAEAGRPELFEECFEVTEKEVLSEKGEKTRAPAKLQKVDERFLR